MTDGGCSKLDVYDWLADMDLPVDHKMSEIVEVRFKGSRKDFYKCPSHLYVERGDLVVVESPTNGFDMGHITLTGELVRLQMRKKRVSEEQELKKVLRKAGEGDLKRWTQAKSLEEETLHIARKVIMSLGLQMKLSDVDYQGDKTKATFYYTADERVDFRELIKRLAEAFRVRIEMRQIGMRQEASRLGGIGSCGRELCCSTWLTDFKSVTTSAARYQNLSINTLKLAGQCGKLKCCLNYELDTYMDVLKEFPDNDTVLETEKGTARLQKTDIFKRIMWYSYSSEESWVPLEVDKVKEIVDMNSRGKKPTDLQDSAFVEVKSKGTHVEYENAVDQDSLTRLDDRSTRSKKKKDRSGRNKKKPYSHYRNKKK